MIEFSCHVDIFGSGITGFETQTEVTILSSLLLP